MDIDIEWTSRVRTRPPDRIEWSEEDREYAGLCAELRSLSWLAPTQVEALKGIQKLVREVLADMKAHKEPIPEPLAMGAYSGEFRVRIPSFVHRQLVIEAAERGVSLNRLVSAKLANG